MSYLSKNAAIIKIKMLQNSSAANYFETNERLFLNNSLEKLEYNKNNQVESDIATKIELIFKKYQKYV